MDLLPAPAIGLAVPFSSGAGSSTPPVRIHIPALVHRDVTLGWEPCAYTGKILRLCKMLTGQGHEVYLYSGPDNDAAVKEHVTVVTAEDRQRWFGDETWEETVFNEFDANSAPWLKFNAGCTVEIAQRLEPHDVIFLTMGASQAALQQAFPNNVVAECGVGYEGVLHSTHRCFESEAWRHYVYGKTGVNDGRFYDTVIYNAFDPDDYLFYDEPGDYLLFMARHIERKGTAIVAEIAKHHKVISAGQGESIPGVEHLGVVRGVEKAALIAGARALLSPTLYVGPFEGVTAEAMISGVPVITTPFGCYSETVSQGVSGFKCSTLAEFLTAADAITGLDRALVRRWAERFTLDVCAPQYDRWLHQLQTLYGAGFYA